MIETKARIGDGTRIWPLAKILDGAEIGDDCNICDFVFIENNVVLGDRVTVKCGVQLWDGITLEDDVFIGPNATFTNDIFPRSREWKATLPTLVRRGASIGANATILPGVVIGEGAMVGAGAVVIDDVPSRAVVVGNPARIMKPVSDRPKWISLQTAGDERGMLAALEHAELPFVPRRTFFVHSVPKPTIRGQHAHRVCEQFLICAQGSVTVSTSGNTFFDEFDLDTFGDGLYVPPMHWTCLSNFSEDAVLVVLASHPYDPKDYIRDYAVFEALL